MTRRASPYEDTAVSVERSQTQIKKMLRDAGAIGVQFDEEWGSAPVFRVRFAWPIQDGKQIVRLEVNPLPADRRTDAAQRERQAWRGIAHYLEGTLKAAKFGLVRFEEIFLAFMELPDGDTVGGRLIPQIRAGRLALPAGKP